MKTKNDKHPIFKEFKNSIPDPIIDEISSSVKYLGYTTEYGIREDEQHWRIEKIEKIGTVTKTTYAGGFGKFSFKWSDRLTLKYSR